MDQLELCDAIVTATDALAEVARRAPDVVVPSCPAWDVRQLAFHVGSVHRMATSLVGDAVQDAAGLAGLFVRPDSDEDPVAWVEVGAAALVDVLRAADPGAPVFTFWPPTQMSFWARRMAHETVIHRWDAQAAVGPPDPIAGELAVSGVEELLQKIDGDPRVGEIAPEPATVHLHATDVPGEWLLTFTPSGLTVDRAHAKGDVAVRAGASDLDLLLSGRLDAGSVEAFGDRDLLGHLLAISPI